MKRYLNIPIRGVPIDETDMGDYQTANASSTESPDSPISVRDNEAIAQVICPTPVIS